MKEEQTHVSIVIPSYNSFNTLGFVISSLLEQSSFNHIKEIIIVDSSEDGKTKQLLDSFESKKIKVVHSGQRIMPAIQRNIGAKSSTGHILIFIDSDIFIEKDYIKKILNAYISGYYAGSGSYNIPEFQKNSKVALAQYYLNLSEFINAGNKKIKKLLPSGNLFCDRALFFKVGGFPEIRASEDSLFTLKISESKKIIFLPDARVYHIFNENWDSFLSSQFLMGKHIFFYRKLYYNSFYLKGILPFFFLPIIIIWKFIRIYMRILKARGQHINQFNKSVIYIIHGLNHWGKGFNDGVLKFKHIDFPNV